jgi:hypothetical protein
MCSTRAVTSRNSSVPRGRRPARGFPVNPSVP